MNLSLFLNFIKTGFRNIIRNKFFSTINIMGLAFAMSFGILMVTYLTGLLNFDDFHNKKDRIYKVYTKYAPASSGNVMDFASSSPYVAHKLNQDYSGVEDILILKGGNPLNIKYESENFQLNGYATTGNFFQFFSFDLLTGNPEDALSKPKSVVISETVVSKYFLGKEPFGKLLNFSGVDYVITGVFKDPPKNTHLGDFDLLLSLPTNSGNSLNRSQWANIWSDHVYILVDSSTSEESIRSSFNDLVTEENNDRGNVQIEPYLIGLTDIVPGQGQINRVGITTDWKDLNKLIILSLVLILIGCFNYTNLTIAQSFKRVREVGVRKVFGAGKSHIFYQFIAEAIIVAILALLIAYPLQLLLRPIFVQEVLKEKDALFYNSNKLALVLLLFISVLGLIAGALPALKLAELKVNQALKGFKEIRFLKWLTSRKFIIIAQFSVALILIFSTIICYKQYKFATTYDFGYKTENILNIQFTDRAIDFQVFKSEIEKIPGVSKVSSSEMVPGLFAMSKSNIVAQKDTIEILYNKVDANYFALHEIDFIAGDGLWRERNDSIAYVAIDQELSKRLGFEQPQDAVGELVDFPSENLRLMISGILDNYEYTNLEVSSAPAALIQNFNSKVNVVSVLLESDDVLSSISKIESVWNNLDPKKPFAAELYNDQIEKSYASYKRMFRVFSILSALVVIISMIGLAGMIVLVTESRMKELNIRKVLGASRKSITILFAGEYVWNIVVASFVSVLLTMYLVEKFLLINFRARIELGYDEFLPGLTLIFSLVVAIVLWQTIRASKSNPAKGLRND